MPMTGSATGPGIRSGGSALCSASSAAGASDAAAAAAVALDAPLQQSPLVGKAGVQERTVKVWMEQESGKARTRVRCVWRPQVDSAAPRCSERATFTAKCVNGASEGGRANNTQQGY